MKTDHSTRFGTYLGGLGVSGYAYAGDAPTQENLIQMIPDSITLMQLQLTVLGVTVGDVCALLGAVAVVGRMALDWKKYRDEKRRNQRK